MVTLHDVLAPLQSGALALATVLSLALVVISVLSYRRSHESRLLLISVAFGLFLAKNVTVSYLVYASWLEGIFLYYALFDTAVLLSFYLALFSRR